MTEYPQTVEYIAEKLQGTCDSLSTVLERYDMEEAEDDVDFYHQLDTLVFCCDTCGWWCEQSEMAEDQDWVCNDCAD